MKNPGMGKLAKAAGSPHKFGIEHKGIDSAARGTKGIGPDGKPLKMKKDFGMEGSAMKFKAIRDKIADRKARKLGSAQDPDEKRGRQDIAETGVVKDRSQGSGRLKEVQVDTEGNVKSMQKEKVRGRDVIKKDGTVKKKGRRIVKDFDAEGKKTKKVYDSDGNLLKEKTSKTRKLDKKNIGKAAEKKVARARSQEAKELEKTNKTIREANEKTTTENEAIRSRNEGKLAEERKKYNAWREKQIADGAENVPTFDEALSKRGGEAPAPTTMKRKSAFKKDEGGKIEAKVTIPGSDSDKIVQAKTDEEKAAYAEYLKNETPEQKKKRLERESGSKSAEDREYKSEYTYEKEKSLTPEEKAKRKEGKFNQLEVKAKKRKKFKDTKVGKKLSNISLKKGPKDKKKKRKVTGNCPAF